MTVPQPSSKKYERGYKRGLYGMIGDRYAEGIDSIVVVGDLLEDRDEFYTTVKHRDGYPVLRLDRVEVRPGGAGAVAQMVEALGVNCILATGGEVSVKRRIIADGEVKCRIDEDKPAAPPIDLPPADLVLIADYAKGAITDETMRRIHRQYKGKQIIADWHPSRAAGFYGDVFLKSSWGPAFIRTNEFGIWLGSERFFQEGDAIDPCGAGDAVLASLGVSRLSKHDWREGCWLAAINAAKVCSSWGAKL